MNVLCAVCDTMIIHLYGHDTFGLHRVPVSLVWGKNCYTRKTIKAGNISIESHAMCRCHR
jgi:hypothetical protein